MKYLCILLLILTIPALSHSSMSSDKVMILVAEQLYMKNLNDIIMFDDVYMEFDSTNRDLFNNTFKKTTSNFDKKTFKDELYDCDDIARYTAAVFIKTMSQDIHKNQTDGAIPFGIIHFKYTKNRMEAYHMTNIYVRYGRVYIYDQQTNKYLLIEDITEVYKVIF